MTPQAAAKPRRNAAKGGGKASVGKASARRGQLQAIAAELFATKGYAQTTVRDIADEAGILSGSLYHHFDSKEAMLGEILSTFMDGLLAEFAEIAADGTSPRERLDGLVRASFRIIHEQPHSVALYQNESRLLAGLPEFEFVEKQSRQVEAVWVEVLAAGRESGDFREDLDSGIVYRLIRDSVWATVRWYNPRGRLKHTALADQFIAMTHGGILTR